MVEVVGTEEFSEWFRSLDESEQDSVAQVVDLLEEHGATLRFPYSSAIEGTSKRAPRELKIQWHGRPIRVFYGFDPIRQAVLLIGGDKTGEKRFYERMIPVAERSFDENLQEMAQ